MTTSNLMYDLETDILNKIVEYLVNGEIEKYSAQWQIEKLKEIGGLNRDVQRILKKYRKGIQTGTKTEIENTSKKVFAELREYLPNSKDAEIRMTADLQNQIDTWLRGADNDMNIAMAKMGEAASTEYVNALNKASLSVVVGQSTLREAIKMSVTDTINKGLPPFIDKANRKWSPEAYTQMVIRSNQRRVSTDTMINAGQQIGAERVEISSHIGARPKCAIYQGTIMTYDDLYNNTSWGEKDGLNGINCGHFFYPFKEGMTQRYKPYPAEQNEKVYKESQKQRLFERTIRNSKRLAKLRETEGNTVKSQYYKDKVKKTQELLRQFIKETGRTRRNDREQIYG